MEYIELGTTPYDEPCAQVGSENYRERVRDECERFKKQLIRQFGEPPMNCGFRVKGFPHDFGTYYELCVNYDPEDEQAVEYAFNVEDGIPANWD